MKTWWEGPEWSKDQKFFFRPEPQSPKTHVYLDYEGKKIYVYVGDSKALECKPQP